MDNKKWLAIWYRVSELDEYLECEFDNVDDFDVALEELKLCGFLVRCFGCGDNGIWFEFEP